MGDQSERSRTTGAAQASAATAPRRAVLCGTLAQLNTKLGASTSPMLVNLRLRNYRCFQDHELPFRALSILVGKNNAGKSSVAEALRLISLVTARHDRLPFKNPPASL